MNYFKILTLCSTVFLSGCISSYLSPKDTIVPLPTFGQYEASPLFFNSVLFSNSGLKNSSNDITPKLRQGFSLYYNSRFQENMNYNNVLNVVVKKQDVTKTYLQVGSDNDVFSSWKSFDQYVFSSNIEVRFKCEKLNSESVESIVISKQVKVPVRYSLYEKDLYLVSVLEKYIDNIDQEIFPYIKSQ